MNNSTYFLKPNVVIEPLVDRWYAWSHLISPATWAMNIVGRHLKIMNSYIQSPHLHAAAVQNPKMLGGPFIDYKGNCVDEIQQLKNLTENRHERLISFANAIILLDDLLKKKARGFSLESLYSQVPDLLKGYVELVYDLNNNPSFRFYESLLYQSDFYPQNSQSIALWLTGNDDRPFCLSTPQLGREGLLHLEIPFRHQGIDKLSEMKRSAGSIDEVARLLNINEDDMEQFRTFFTEKSLPGYQKYKGEKTRMRYFGHACILLETSDVSILIDPLISYYGYDSTVDHFSDIDLPDEIDYILITHNHQDHVVLESLLPLRHKVKKIIVPLTKSGSLQDPSLKMALNQCGFYQVYELDEMEVISFGDCTITGIPFLGEHSDLNIRAKICFHIQMNGFKFLFVADSRVLEKKLYEHVQKIIGDIDVLFLGMECEGAPLTWLYGPLLTAEISRENDQSRRLSGSDYLTGITLVDIFRPSEVYVYAMGQEPWLKFISSLKYTEESAPIIESNKLIAACHKRGLSAERLYGEKELLYSYKRGEENLMHKTSRQNGLLNNNKPGY